MKKEFTERRKRSIEFTLPEYLKLIDDFVEKGSSSTVNLEEFAKHLGVSKVFEVVRCESRVFVFYKDNAEDTEAFLNVEKKYRLSDAFNALEGFFGLEDGDCHKLNVEETQRFETEFGFPAIELFDEESEHFILDLIAERFSNNYDCNVAENDQWQDAIKATLKELKNKN